MVLNVGDEAPNFTYTNQDGKLREFHSVPGKKIVFFYPKAFTPTCTKEICSIQDTYQELKQEGITEIFGISLDGEAKQQKFGEKYGVEYILVSDGDKKISQKYGVATRKYLIFSISKRFTFIVNEDNQITSVFENGLKGEKSKYGIENHGNELMETLREH